MPLFGFVKNLFRRKRPKTFTLGDRGQPGIPGGGEDVIRGKHLERRPFATKEAVKASRRGVWKELREDQWAERSADSVMDVPRATPFGGMSPGDRRLMGKKLSKSLDDNLKTVQWLFRAPRNADLAVRKLKIKRKGGYVEGALMYMPSLADEKIVRENILKPLMHSGALKDLRKVAVRDIAALCITGMKTAKAEVVSLVVSGISTGNCLVLLEGDSAALNVDTKCIEHRAVEESPTEAVVRGPHQGFVEDLETNTGLVRKHLANPQLISERYFLGARSHAQVAIMYLESVANPKLVDEVRRRITSVKAASITTNSQLREYIKDKPRDPFPTVGATERPDKVANMIAEGHVAVLGDSPATLMVPGSMWSMMHSSEDYYINSIIASFLRMIRWGALLSTLLASAMYVAIVTHHPEMLPTELMFSIAATREGVPLPAELEATILELGFELIREGGIRVPTVIGPTIGIVGAVILGQAAVQAGIVSPILVVVVALSGLGSFAIPNYDLSLWARLARFLFIFAGALLGIPGLTLLGVVMITRILSLRSFGVPVTAPVLPKWKHSPDIVVRGTFKSMEFRPGYTRPLDPKRKTPNLAKGSPADFPGPGPDQENS